MTVQPTSRRALLKGAAMLTAIPVAALGGIPVFDVVEEALPVPVPHPFALRIATAGEWLGLPPPALVYDPEDPAGGPLLTDELAEWMGDAGRQMTAWILSETPEGYTREAALADHAEWVDQREFLEAISHLDETEMRLLLDAMERSVRGEESLETGLVRCKQAMEAHRAAKATRAMAA